MRKLKYGLLLILLLGNFMISNSSPINLDISREDTYMVDLHFKIPIVTATRIYKYTKEELDLLARLIYAESGNQPLLGMIAVGNVVRNRARIKNQTIKEIIFQRDKRGRPQFDGIDTKYFYRKPTEKALQAARLAFQHDVVPNTVYYFHNPVASTDRKHVRFVTKYFYKQIADHVFCYYNKKI